MSNNGDFLSNLAEVKDRLPFLQKDTVGTSSVILPNDAKKVVQSTLDNLPKLFYSHGKN